MVRFSEILRNNVATRLHREPEHSLFPQGTKAMLAFSYNVRIHNFLQTSPREENLVSSFVFRIGAVLGCPNRRSVSQRFEIRTIFQSARKIATKIASQSVTKRVEIATEIAVSQIATISNR